MRDAQSPGSGRIYATVLRTYLRRPWPLFWSVWVVAGAAFASSPRATTLVLRGAQPTVQTMYDNLVISAIFLCVTCGHFAALVSDQTSRLLALPLGFLTPRLRGPATLIAVCLTLGSLGLMLAFWPPPLLPAARAHFSIYAGAIATLIAAEFAWVQIWTTLGRVGPLPIVGGLLPWTAFTLPAVRHTFVQMLAGERPLLAAALYALSAILFTLLWLVLANRRQVGAVWGSSGAADCAQAPVSVGEIPWLHVAASPWRRFRLRAFVTSAGSHDAWLGAVGGLLLTVIAVTLQYLYGQGDPGTPLALSLVVTILAPVIVAARTAALRPVMLVHDVLLPQSRRAFARDHGLAIFANQLCFWVAAQVTLAVSYALLAPEGLRLYGPSLAIMLPISAAFQIFFFGLLAWYLSFPPSYISGSLLFGISLGMVPLNISFFNRPTPLASASFACAAAMLVAGVALVFTSLRRWSRCEIR